MEYNPEKLVFFYPSHTVGGAEYLIIRLVEYLNSIYKCYIVDFKDGIYNKLGSNFVNSRIISFSKNFFIPNDAHIITFPSEMYRLLNNINNNNNLNKVLFWAIHPDNFQNLILLKHRSPDLIIKHFWYHLIGEAIDLLCNKKALIAMDEGILERYKYLYKKQVKVPLCPIPIPIKDNIAYERGIEYDNKVRCVWLGRISGEKVYTLKKIIEDINSLEVFDVQFDIIGTGEYDYIIKGIKVKNSLKINYLGVITNNLDEVLVKYDVCFAMGTSILESAKLKIPSILVDASYVEMPPNYKYRWLYQSKGLTLGYLLPNENIKDNSLTMFDILNTVKNPTKKIEIGNRCYFYAKEHHSLEFIVRKLIYFIRQSNLRINDLRALRMSKIWKIYKILRTLIRREKNH